MTEMRYRRVDATVNAYSGSDDHAKHIVYWSLASGAIMFRDDDVTTLEHILSAVSTGDTLDDAYRGEAAGLLEQVVWAGNDVTVERVEIKDGGGI